MENPMVEFYIPHRTLIIAHLGEEALAILARRARIQYKQPYDELARHKPGAAFNLLGLFTPVRVHSQNGRLSVHDFERSQPIRSDNDRADNLLCAGLPDPAKKVFTARVSKKIGRHVSDIAEFQVGPGIGR